MKKLSNKIFVKLSRYDKYLLEKYESNILSCRREYCDIFESMCLIESNKPSASDSLAYIKYQKSINVLQNRLKMCMRHYNNMLIKYYAHIELCEEEYRNE